MKFENLKEFIRRSKKSKSTIYRFYKKNDDLFSETKMMSDKRYFPIHHEKYFNSEKMYEENKILMSENKSMRNLIDCLSDTNSLQYKLWTMDWSFFCTIAYKTERNKKSCFRQMTSMYSHLLEKYRDDTELRMFFVTEPFTNRTGYHNHFVLHISNKELHKDISNEIKNFFRYDRVDLEPYNRYRGGLFYISKDGLSGEDWDILGTNLHQTGL